MRADRWLIAALLFLVGGLWLIFAWCHGNVGLSVAFPAEGTKLGIDFTSTGWPVMVGLPLVFVGLVLMLLALIGAFITLFRGSEAGPEEDSITRLKIPFDE
ncbi:MAG TPA: hypothetical protein VG225_00440 [Terracidiphilus sp.]|jgi:hypothetical protein|nr:hypothetical protein [Terracidiphilus sp.]